jgi:molybdenum cofactor synthesis domain-containing protein
VPEVELIDKTEIWIDGVALDDADLGELAAVAARVLQLPSDRVYVTDVRDGRVTFDVLVPRLRLEQVVGRADELRTGIGRVEGVTVAPDADVHSAGVLGAITTPADEVHEVLALAEELDTNLRRWVDTRVAVVSTGGEVARGEVRDTNQAAARELLGPHGFEVTSGGTVPDDERVIAGRIARLVGDGFGLVITTGGVGAEDKDRTIEAVAMLDPSLATSTLASYTPGTGRHVKADVRVAVAEVGWSRVVCLPGPTREVVLGLGALVDGLAAALDAPDLVEAIGAAIRAANRTHGVHS